MKFPKLNLIKIFSDLPWRKAAVGNDNSLPEEHEAPSQSVQEAIRTGIEQGKRESDLETLRQQARQKKDASDLAASFANASGVIAGLKVLHDMPGSKFEFSPSTVFNSSVHITTNIGTVNGYGPGDCTLFILARADGKIAAYGDSTFDHKRDSISVDKTESGADNKILTFVAKYAAKRGLIPAA